MAESPSGSNSPCSQLKHVETKSVMVFLINLFRILVTTPMGYSMCVCVMV